MILLCTFPASNWGDREGCGEQDVFVQDSSAIYQNVFLPEPPADGA